MKRAIVAAYLGLMLPVFADGDDDLGLPQLDAPVPDASTAATGYFMHDGTMYALVGGGAVPLDREVRMRITPRHIVGFAGRPIRLPAGQMLMADGTLQPLPIQPRPPALPVATAPTTVTVNTTTTPVAAAAAPVLAASATPVLSVANNTSATTTTAPITPAPGAAVTGASPITTATVPPPQPGFATPLRPDRTGPLMDVERPMDRTRPDSVPNRTDDPTKLRDEQRPPDRTRAGTDDQRPRDRTLPGPDDYRVRDRTMPGTDDQRPPDPTRRPAR